MSKDTKRALIYARVSTAGQSVASQLDALRAVAAQRGWEVLEEFVDHGVSGARDSRPALDAMMARIRKGGAKAPQVLLIFRLDRLGRSVAHLIRVADELHARGVDLVSVNDGVDSTGPTGRFVFVLVAACAELERSITRERVRHGMESARRRGARIGRPRARFDLDQARELIAAGASIRSVAKTLGVGATTLTTAPRPAGAERCAEKVADGALADPEKMAAA